MTIAVDVLGLGNSLIDIIAYADDAYLGAQEMLKGAMTLIDEDRAEALYAARVDPSIVSGGSFRPDPVDVPRPLQPDPIDSRKIFIRWTR